MSGIGFGYNPTEVVRALQTLAVWLDDLTPTMKQVGAAVQTEVDLLFKQQEDPWGNPWAELTETTKKNRKGTSYQILSDTKVLANGLTWKASKDDVTFGTPDERAGPLFFGAEMGEFGSTSRGSPIPWGDIPARPWYPIKNDKVDLPADWQDVILEAIVGSVPTYLR